MAQPSFINVFGAGVGAASNAVATLTSAAGVTAYLSGLNVTGLGATAGSVIQVTVAGILGGTQNFGFTVATGATVLCSPLVIVFAVPLVAAGPNTNIVVTAPSFGAGNTASSVNAWGFLA